MWTEKISVLDSFCFNRYNYMVFLLLVCLLASLVIRTLATRQKMYGTNSDSVMDVCGRSDSTLKGGRSLFSPHVENMIPKSTNLPLVP